MNVRLNVAWLLALTAGLGMYGLSLAQQPQSATAPPTSELPPQANGLPTGSSDVPPLAGQWQGSSAYPIAAMPGRVNAVPSIRQAAEAVRDAEGSKAKADAQERLMEQLAKYFDDDMKRREKELTEIEQRLTKLLELLDRRRNSKQEIIELQAKVALNEAEGLGFYEGSQAVDPFAAASSAYGAELAPPTVEPAQMQRQ